MADKKQESLEDVVGRNELYRETPPRTRARDYLGGTITPNQYPQWRSHNDAARAADVEDVEDAIKTGNRNMDRRIKGYSKGGMVKHGSPTDCGPMCADTKTIKGG